MLSMGEVAVLILAFAPQPVLAEGSLSQFQFFLQLCRVVRVVTCFSIGACAKS